jgi:hypothetical protein
MMEATEKSTGVTYGALIGFTLAIVATLAITGGAGYYLGQSGKEAPAVNMQTSTTSQLSGMRTIFDAQEDPISPDEIQQAATSPYSTAPTTAPSTTPSATK